MFARCWWSTTVLLILAVRAPADWEAIRVLAPERYIIEPPDVLLLDGCQSLRSARDIIGKHQVQSDGTIALGRYGRVPVAGLTASQANSVIEQHLSKQLDKPEIRVSVAAFNSKVCTVIVSKDNQEQQRLRFPLTTGYETVSDALAQIKDGPRTCKVWLARPIPAKKGSYYNLPIDQNDLGALRIEAGHPRTNYTLRSGDEIHVEAQPDKPTGAPAVVP